VIDSQGMGPGHKLGKYELLLPVAQGGMATIWAARLRGPRGFSKMVAVKAMMHSLGEDPQFEQMFLAEAKLAARIRHPNVCEMFDFGEQDGVLYIAMEWIEGEPLGAIGRTAARKQGIPLGVICRVGAAAAMGLHAAHELTDEMGVPLGLVHRDVSPQNILVKYDGEVKIIDFGIAKAAGPEIETPKTRVGQMKGTLSYMSPEQAGSGQVDRRSDIFSLGVVLYQLIGGVHPFKADNEFQTLTRILAPAPALPLLAVNSRCPRSLNTVVMRALEKQREKRWSSMAELAQALEGAMHEVAAMEPPVDLGAFVRDVVGSRSERRSAALREAERLIEDRAALGAQAPHGPVPSPQLRLTMPSLDMTTATLARAATTASMPATPPVTTLPPSRRTQRTALLVAGGLVLAVAGTVGAVRSLRSGDPAQAQTATTSEVGRPAPGGTTAQPAVTASASATAAVSASATPVEPVEPIEPVPVGGAGKSRNPTSAGTGQSTATGQGTAAPKPKGAATNLPRLTDPGF
jgi:serine/threonine protein kinase